MMAVIKLAVFINLVYKCDGQISILNTVFVLTLTDMSHQNKHSQTFKLHTISAPLLFLLCLITLSFQVQDDHAHLKTTQSNQVKIDTTQIHIQQINQLTFNQFLKFNEHTLIYFYTDDCQFCQQFHQTFNQMKKAHIQSEMGKTTKISFGTLKLTKESQQIFKDFNVEAVPDLKYFRKAKPSSYLYVFNEYNKRSMSKHLKWLQRVSLVEQFEQKISQTHKLSIFGHWKELKQSYYIKEIYNIQELSKKLMEDGRRAFIFNCSYEEKESENGQLSRFLKRAFLEQLEEQFYCTNNHSLLLKDPSNQFKNTNEAFINVYGLATNSDKAQFKHKIPLDIQISSDLSSRDPQQNTFQSINAYNNGLHEVYWHNFMNYMKREVEYWSQSSVIEVFQKNQSGFVLIMSNETVSKGLFEHYKQIKQRLNHQSQVPSIKFYHSDLSATPQQTTKIKKHIFGIQISTKDKYPFPALGYLKPSVNYVKKYIFPLDLELTRSAMQIWMLKVLFQVQKINKNWINPELSSFTDISSNPLHQEIVVKQHFRTTPEQLFPTRYLNSFRSIYYDNTISKQQKDLKLKIPEKFFTHKKQLKPINYKDFQILLSYIFKESFFVFINSRNDLNSYQLYTEISEWIEDDQDQNLQDQEQTQEYAQQPEQQHQEEADNQQHHLEGPPKPQTQLKTNTNALQIQNDLKEHKDQNQPQRILQQIKQQQQTVNQNDDHKNEQQIQMEQIKKLKIQTTHKLLTEHNQATKTAQIQKTTTINDEQHHKLTEQQLFEVINFYILNFNSNDYPPTYQDINGKLNHIDIEYFPALIYFSNDKTSTTKLQGVQTIDQIKQFILKELSKQFKREPTEELVKEEAQRQEDRELEGQVITNIDN